MRRGIAILIGAIVAASFAAAARAQIYATAGSQQYSVADIGNLSSQYPYCSVNAINSLGQVAGDSNVSPSDGAHGYFYAGNGAALVDLGPTGAGGAYTQSLANGINDSSWIVGSVNGEASVWTPRAGLQAVGFLGTGNYSGFDSISNGDVAVGGATTLGGSYANPIIWDPTNGLRDLNSLIVNPPSTWTPTDAVAISQTGGLIAGIGYSNIGTAPPSGTKHAFVLNAGTLSEIPDPGTSIDVFGINSSGEVAGVFQDSSGHSHAFVYASQHGIREIESLGLSVTGSTTPIMGAAAVNDLGTVVGADDWADGSGHAFIYTDAGGVVEFDPPAGVVFDGAYGINDSGQVIAQGYYADDTALGYRGFVLTPTPEPNTMLLLAASILAGITLGWSRRRRRSPACQPRS